MFNSFTGVRLSPAALPLDNATTGFTIRSLGNTGRMLPCNAPRVCHKHSHRNTFPKRDHLLPHLFLSDRSSSLVHFLPGIFRVRRVGGRPTLSNIVRIDTGAGFGTGTCTRVE